MDLSGLGLFYDILLGGIFSSSILCSLLTVSSKPFNLSCNRAAARGGATAARGKWGGGGLRLLAAKNHNHGT